MVGRKEGKKRNPHRNVLFSGSSLGAPGRQQRRCLCPRRRDRVRDGEAKGHRLVTSHPPCPALPLPPSHGKCRGGCRPVRNGGVSLSLSPVPGCLASSPRQGTPSPAPPPQNGRRGTDSRSRKDARGEDVPAPSRPRPPRSHRSPLGARPAGWRLLGQLRSLRSGTTLARRGRGREGEEQKKLLRFQRKKQRC